MVQKIDFSQKIKKMVNDKNNFFSTTKHKLSLYGKEKDPRKNKTFVRVKDVAKKVLFLHT